MAGIHRYSGRRGAANTPSGAIGQDDAAEASPYKSSIAILPSSMPTYHRAYMEKLKAEKSGASYKERPAEQANPKQTGTPKLKLQSRSQINLEKADQKPEGLTPMPAKKPRQTRWQFGIRSRNPPLDAMYCIYRALQRLGAEWEDAAKQQRSSEGDEGGEPGRNNGPRASSVEGRGRDPAATASKARSSADKASDPDHGHYMPPDPWLIRCRWLTESSPNLAAQSGSGRSSMVNLGSPEPGRDNSAKTSPSLGGGGGGGFTPTPDGSISDRSAINRVYVYMEIQLYQIEKDFYLVDFKCAGYERLLYEAVDADESSLEETQEQQQQQQQQERDLEDRVSSLDLRTAEGNAAGVRHLWKIEQKVRRARRVGRRPAREDERVSSPFPFLDLASKLIIALAEGD